MWQCDRQVIDGGLAIRHFLHCNGKAVSYREVLQGWQQDEVFRSFFISLLANCTFRAFRWETPPVTSQSVNREFEFVFLDTPELDLSANPEPFRDRFSNAGAASGIVTFSNLGGDAVLVVPCPTVPLDDFGHLGAFIRNAKPAQVHALWQAVGIAMAARLGTAPLWLSTAGMGVPWLHVRLDLRPKYFRFAEYRTVN